MSPASAHALLTEARALLGSPDRWTKQALARDESGERADPTEENATCFCLIGSLDAAAHKLWGGPQWEHDKEIAEAEAVLGKALMGRGIAGFNDDPHTTHADVLAVLDTAVEKSR